MTPVDNNISALTGALLFYVAPLGLGLVVYTILANIFRIRSTRERNDHDIFEKLSTGFVVFALGALTVYGATNLIALTQGKEFSLVFMHLSKTGAIVVPILGIIILVIKAVRRKISLKEYLKLGIVLITIIAIAVTSQCIWKWKSLPPFSTDWDAFFHQRVISQILSGNYSYKLSELTDTVRVDPYSTIFHVLGATAQAPLKPRMLEFWWFVDFLHLITVTVASFIVGYGMAVFLDRHKVITETTDRSHIALGVLTALFGGLTFDSFISFTTYFLIPQTLTAVITGGALGWTLIKLHKKKYRDLLFLPFVLVYLVLNHYVIGALGVCFIVGVVAYSLLKEKLNAKFFDSLVLGTCMVVFFVLPLVARDLDPDKINQGEAAYYIFSVKEKADNLVQYYGYLHYLLLPLGILVLLRGHYKHRALIIGALIISTALLMSPIPYNMKFYSVIRYLVHIIMAFGVITIVGTRPVFSPRLVVGSTVLTISLLFALANNVYIYKQTPRYRDTYTVISPNEIAAGEFLQTKYKDKNVILLSDPASMMVLEGFSNVNSPGGAFAGPETRKALSSIYYSRDPETIGKVLGRIEDRVEPNKGDRTGLLVLSNRYFSWVNTDEERRYGYQFNIWEPEDLKVGDYEFVTYLQDKVLLNKVYENNGLVVFEVPLEAPRTPGSYEDIDFFNL